MLKNLAKIIDGSLSTVYQRLFESGEVPADCKLVSLSYLDQSVPMTGGNRPVRSPAQKWEGKRGRVGRWELGPKTEQWQRSKEEILILINMISECKITQYNTI